MSANWPSGSSARRPCARCSTRVGAVDAWLVGGTVRDALLAERALDEPDLVVAGDAERAARALAERADAFVFPLSERFGAWRVIARDRTWQSDVTPARGTIEEDLALRDFTINAMAVPVQDPGRLIDPHGGEADLRDRTIRAVGPRSFADDPLRALRMVRFACELEFQVEPGTSALAAAAAPQVDGCRARAVLLRAAAADRRARSAARHRPDGLDRAGATCCSPSSTALKGVEQNPYHHLDVWGHTLEVLERRGGRRPPTRWPCSASPARGSRGSSRGRSATSSRVGRRCGSARCCTMRASPPRGRSRTRDACCSGDTTASAPTSRARSAAGCTPAPRSRDFVGALAQHHLHLGFLVHEQPLSRRHVYRYMRKCEPVEVEVTVLSVADRLATLGPRTREEAVEGHLALARELAREALAWRTGDRPHAPIRGDDLIAELGLEPGPVVGRLLDAIDEAAFAGEVHTRDEALELARREASASRSHRDFRLEKRIS